MVLDSTWLNIDDVHELETKVDGADCLNRINSEHEAKNVLKEVAHAKRKIPERGYRSGAYRHCWRGGTPKWCAHAKPSHTQVPKLHDGHPKIVNVAGDERHG